MLRYVTLPLVALLLFSACSLLDSNDGELPSPRLENPSLTVNAELLVGTWEWKHTISFWGPHARTRAEEPDTEYWITFDTDTARIYRDGELSWTSAYSVSVSDDGTSGSIVFESRMNHMFGVNEEHLVMSTAHLDGPEEAFVRTSLHPEQ